MGLGAKAARERGSTKPQEKEMKKLQCPLRPEDPLQEAEIPEEEAETEPATSWPVTLLCRIPEDTETEVLVPRR